MNAGQLSGEVSILEVKVKEFLCILFIVVITASVMKVAVTFPLTERDREAQRLASCQSNLRQLTTALQMYWNDWDSKLPSSALVANASNGNPTQSEVINYVSGKDPITQTEGTKPVSYIQILWPHMRYKDIVFCPSDTPRSRSSYWWKYAIDLAWRDPGIRAQHEGDYAFSADQIILYEHAGWHFGDAAGIKNGVKINASYMDGHVATVTMNNAPTSYPPVADERNGAAGIRLGAPMYYNFDSNTNQPHPGVADYINPTRYYDKY
jgi:hypothetical protein